MLRRCFDQQVDVGVFPSLMPRDGTEHRETGVAVFRSEGLEDWRRGLQQHFWV